MITIIWIVVKCDDKSIVYSSAISCVKNKIREYLGSRNCEADNASIPAVAVTCDVTQDDINNLNKIINYDSIHLIAMINAEDSKRINGDIIDLREE